MSEQGASEQGAIPAEWRRAADETAKCLSVARAIERQQYPEGEAPDGLLSALVISAALARVHHGCLTVADEVERASAPMLIERLAGLESELFRLANTADDAFKIRTDPARTKGHGDGGK